MKRFGIPPGGAMDEHAAGIANRLVGNEPGAPLLEFLLQGASLRVLGRCWIAVTGADQDANLPLWQTIEVEPGARLEFPRARSGVWAYLAIEGGFEATRRLGSVAPLPGAPEESLLRAGSVLSRPHRAEAGWHRSIATRRIAAEEIRDYENPPPLEVWPGPQWDAFSERDRERFFSVPWQVTARSNRVGYRLAGPGLDRAGGELWSEPTMPGVIQIPPDGQPMVLMRDGPTVGGYPKLGVLAPAHLAWLAQCRPNQTVRFVPAGLGGC